MAARSANSSEASTPAAIPRPDEIYDPVARALDWIGDKWTLVLVRHLLYGPAGFQELRKRTGIAPRVLSARLRDLARDGYVESIPDGARSRYAVTDRGRSLEPVIAAIARWYVLDGMRDFEVDTRKFTANVPQSILGILPFIVREDRAADADVTFEIRLEGEGGGVWTVEVKRGACRVTPGFAERADVRYTADAIHWCAVALGRLDARDAAKRGLLKKDGGTEAMDFYFHQIARGGADADPRVGRADAGDERSQR
ncbi:MAG TPA: winged helix-turn-helix transcriptional regulator [Myxococcota bacterium]|nr:winged helix-turn-helix transcriptional regulator [Myxococcota bacterium]